MPANCNYNFNAHKISKKEHSIYFYHFRGRMVIQKKLKFWMKEMEFLKQFTHQMTAASIRFMLNTVEKNCQRPLLMFKQLPQEM